MKLLEVPKANLKKFQNQTSRSPKMKPPEVAKINFKRFQKGTQLRTIRVILT